MHLIIFGDSFVNFVLFVFFTFFGDLKGPHGDLASVCFEGRSFNIYIFSFHFF